MAFRNASCIFGKIKTMRRKIRFIDCGANKGQSVEWALITFGDLYDFELSIDSFEPLPENFVKLAQKYKHLGNVSLHEAAVSYSDGRSIFYCDHGEARTGSSLIEGKRFIEKENKIVVDTVDLAKWIQKNVSFDETIVLKIDVEGFEYELLPVLLNSGLHNRVQYWMVEFHGQKVPGDAKTKDAIRSRFCNSVNHFFDWSKADYNGDIRRKILKVMAQ